MSFSIECNGEMRIGNGHTEAATQRASVVRRNPKMLH